MGSNIVSEKKIGNTTWIQFDNGKSGLIYSPTSKEKPKYDKWEMLRDLIIQEFETCKLCDNYEGAYVLNKVLDHMERIENDNEVKWRLNK